MTLGLSSDVAVTENKILESKATVATAKPPDREKTLGCPIGGSHQQTTNSAGSLHYGLWLLRLKNKHFNRCNRNPKNLLGKAFREVAVHNRTPADVASDLG